MSVCVCSDRYCVMKKKKIIKKTIVINRKFFSISYDSEAFWQYLKSRKMPLWLVYKKKKSVSFDSDEIGEFLGR